MCTIIVVNHHYKEFPLVIAANRDEDYNRLSTPVQVLAREPHLIIGSQDGLKGGTWLGVNKHSLFVAVTNQGDKNGTLESRGRLVIDALKRKTLDELIAFVEELNPSKYNKFNLVFGNSKTIFIAHSYILHSMVIRELPAGVHIISSDMKFTGDDPKVQYIHKKLDNATDASWLDYYKVLKKTLASSDYGVKIRPRSKKDTGKIFGNCTRSSSILAFSNAGLERYKFHDRTSPRPKKEEKDVPSRYKDYIDLWRNPDAPVSTESEEIGKDDEDKDDLGPKEAIMDVLGRKLKDIEKEARFVPYVDANGKVVLKDDD